ncbi:hypothetical protein QE152_g21631 [Popillia japonica]|uniref:Uncharacterized protein n=1 Tax=Popillia japonica TaxID=7064 RepID=A0AAW1KN36_POPJA
MFRKFTFRKKLLHLELQKLQKTNRRDEYSLKFDTGHVQIEDVALTQPKEVEERKNLQISFGNLHFERSYCSYSSENSRSPAGVEYSLKFTEEVSKGRMLHLRNLRR